MPEGTNLADMSNNKLDSHDQDGTTLFRLLGEHRDTALNGNGEEWHASFKLCIPVSAGMADTGEIEIGANTNVRQYNIYWAENPDSAQQSFLFADPGEIGLYTGRKFSWNVSGETLQSAAIRVKKVDGVGNGLPGAEFQLKDSGGSVVDTETTNSNGEALFDSNIGVGQRYTVVETKAPEGYSVDSSPRTVTAEANNQNNTVEIRVTDENEGVFVIKKTDVQNGALLPGVEFLIESTRSTFKTTVMTRADGKAVLTQKELPAGEYTITETKAPRGYELSRETRTVTWNGSGNLTVTFSNKRQLGLTIMKRDADTNNLLEDAVFNIYRDGQLVTAVVTNDYGVAHVDGLSEGYYEIEEVAAPDGYILDGTRHGIYIDSYNPATDDDPMLIVTNTKLPSLRVRKLDAETMKPLENAVFEIRKDTELLGKYTTDSYGEIELTDIQPGVYEAKEVKAPDGYVTDGTPQSIKIEAGESGELIFLNSAKPGFRIIKIAEDSGKRLEGAVFTVSKVDGSYTQEFISDGNGEIDLTDLEPGVYTIQETTAPDGYVVTDAVRTFEIIEGQNAAFVFTNKEKPDLTIVKQDNKGNRLAGAVVRITKMDDPSIQYEATTDDQGRIFLSDIPEGVYTVKEVIAPTGYLLNEEEFTVALKAGMNGYLTIPDKQKPSLTIKKYDSLTGESMAGVTFEVYKDTTLIGTYTTDENGVIEIEGLEPGIYSVQEIEAPGGYVRSEQEYHVELFPGKQSEIVVVNAEKPSLKIVKTDAITGEPMSDVGFVVRKAEGETENTVVTDENGEAVLEHLEPGIYEVTEASVPDGYLLDPNSKLVTLAPNRTSVVRFKNYPKPNLLVKKIDRITGDVLKGAKFHITYASNNTSTGEINDLGEYTTDETGAVRLYDLKDGWYKVTEVQAPDGYKIDNENQEIYIRAGENKELTFEDTPLSALVIKRWTPTPGRC